MLASAMLHAGMTFFTKQAADKLVFRALSISFAALLFIPVLLTREFPSWEVWRFLLLGAAIIWAFNMALIAAFERGEMNLVYPVMRGGAPMLAAAGAFLFLGEALNPWALGGLLVASLALLGFAWPERNGVPKGAALFFALACALMTAAYSVNDAAGVRAAGDPLLYAGWFFVLSALTLSLTALVRRGRRIVAQARSVLRISAFSALFNAGTYTLALYAFSIAPVAPMTAIRETSFVFGAILGAVLLKESFGRRRVLLAVVLAAGLALLQVFSR